MHSPSISLVQIATSYATSISEINSRIKVQVIRRFQYLLDVLKSEGMNCKIENTGYNLTLRLEGVESRVIHPNQTLKTAVVKEITELSTFCVDTAKIIGILPDLITAGSTHYF